MSRVWYDPRTWFSRAQAANGLNKATTAALQSALTNYIKAVNNLPTKNSAHIYGVLMQKKNGTNVSYKNRIVNGVANAVVKARKANVMINAANTGAVSETAAAAAVQTATTAVNNLKNVLTNLTTVGVNGTNVKYGKNKTGKWQFNKNTSNNIKSAWKINNSGSLVKITAAANQRPANQRPANQLQASPAANQRQASPAANQSQAPPAAVNNRFKNMNINTLVKSAAQSLSMSNENKVKLKAAIKAKMNTLNENSMNRVRLVNANRNLN